MIKFLKEYIILYMEFRKNKFSLIYIKEMDSLESNELSIHTIILIVVICLIGVYLIYNQACEYYQKDDPVLNKLRENFKNFFNQETYWTGALQELNSNHIDSAGHRMRNIELLKGNKSYTINKEKVFLCLQDENGNYYDMNMLVYVLAHEFAHVICNSVGHTEEFHRIFDQLLKALENFGMYDSRKEILTDYCGHGVEDDDE